MIKSTDFPVDFVWGVATSAYQIEGAAFSDGRSASIWDTFCRTPGKVFKGDTGDIACDHYHLWQDDLDLIKSLGVNAYRFSLSWPRIMPEGQGKLSEKGLDFYDRLVDGILERGLSPYATLYHWDLPQFLEDEGGWPRRNTAYLFADYAEAVVKRLGDRVVSYATLNEPWCSSFLGYGIGLHAPGIQDESKYLQAAHHLLLAHGLALPRMRAHAPKAKHGIVLNYEPAYADQASNQALAQRYEDQYFNWFMAPLFNGQYPQELWHYFGNTVPIIKEGDFDIISKPVDFLGINYYTHARVKHDATAWLELGRYQNPGAKHTDMDWEISPHSLYDLLTRLHKTYTLPELYITENGAAFKDVLQQGKVNDTERIAYLEGHLEACAQAIKAGVNLKGYFAWSLLDNFEWAFGYDKRFGIVYVDFDTQERILKESARWYRNFITG